MTTETSGPWSGMSVGSATIVASTGVFTTSGSHGLSVGDPISLGTITGTTGVVAGVTYYVRTAPSSTTFTLSATPGGSALSLTTDGSTTAVFKGASFSDDDWSAMFGAGHRSGVVGSPGGSQLQVFADATGMNVKVRPGTAFVYGQWYTNTTDTTLTVTSNSSGSPRLDWVVIRRNPATKSANMVVVPGTPAATPAPPALTSADVRLGTVRVESGAVSILPGKVTPARDYTGRGVIPIEDSDFSPAPDLGLVSFSEAGSLQVGTGVGWANIPTGIRIHRDVSSMFFDSNGLLSFPHNLGWSPRYFSANPDTAAVPVLIQVATGGVNITSTNIALRAWNLDGSHFSGNLGTVRWLATD